MASTTDSSPCGLIDGRVRRHTRPCLGHEFIPFQVDPHLRQNHSTPSLHPRYQASTLLWVDPTLCHALYFRPRGSAPCGFSLTSWTPGSQVPRKSPDRDHAAFMPVTTESVNRYRLGWVPGQRLEPGFGDVPTLSTPHRRFTYVRLLGPHLTGSSPAFSRNAHHRGFWPKQ